MKFALAIAVGMVASLLAMVSGARADILNLDASVSGDITFTGMPPASLGVSITTLSGSGKLSTSPDVGTYTLLAPAAPFVAGPASGGVFPIPSVTEGFGYTAADGVLMGIVTWNFLVGGGPLGAFVGTFSGVGSGVFSGFTSGNVLLATTFLNTPSLVSLAAAGGTDNGGVSAGAVQHNAVAIPGPDMATGIPGLVVAIGALFFLARRRRHARMA